MRVALAEERARGRRESAGAADRPARRTVLRPELVPGSKVVEVLAAVHDPAAHDHEDHTAVEVQLLSVSLGDVVVNPDHAAVLIGQHALQVGPERAARLGHVAAETGEDGLPTDDVAGEPASAGGVPRDV